MGKTFLGFFSTLIALSVGTAAPIATVPAEELNYVNENSDSVYDNTADTDNIVNIDNTADTDDIVNTDNICNFVDEDNNGVCDVYEANQGNCSQNGCGRNYVDADNDGVCDNYTNGQGRGCGRGQGNCFRGGRCR